MPGGVIWSGQVPSSSGAKTYAVSLNADGTGSCECVAFAIGRNRLGQRFRCKHLWRVLDNKLRPDLVRRIQDADVRDYEERKAAELRSMSDEEIEAAVAAPVEAPPAVEGRSLLASLSRADLDARLATYTDDQLRRAIAVEEALPEKDERVVETANRFLSARARNRGERPAVPNPTKANRKPRVKADTRVVGEAPTIADAARMAAAALAQIGKETTPGTQGRARKRVKPLQPSAPVEAPPDDPGDDEEALRQFAPRSPIPHGL